MLQKQPREEKKKGLPWWLGHTPEILHAEQQTRETNQKNLVDHEVNFQIKLYLCVCMCEREILTIENAAP